MDPSTEKYSWESPYNYVNNNPVISMDVDGRDGVVVVDKQTKILTVTAVYYVNSQKISNDEVYSASQIENMNTRINETLNSKGYAVSEGEYGGYSVVFNLQFKEGGKGFELEGKLGTDKIEGIPISNTFQKGSDKTYSRFKEVDNGDGTVSKVGGFTSGHNKIVMNSSTDTKHNRIHEIFHTLFFDQDNAKVGIGSYSNPQMPNQNDINTMINNSALPKIEVPKKEQEDEKQ